MYPNIRAEMARKNITQRQLADQVNMKLGAFNRKMNGKSEFTLSNALAIHSILASNMSVEELFEKGK